MPAVRPGVAEEEFIVTLVKLSGRALAALVIVLSLAASRGAAAQSSGRISGTVVDQSGGALAGAKVTLLDAAGASRQMTSTNANGEFAFAGVAPGRYAVQVEQQLFEITKVAVDIGGATSAEPLRITMRVAGFRADPIVVSATRTEEPLSQVPASVSVVTKSDFVEQQATTVGDVLKNLPNVDFGGGPRVDGQIPTIRGYQGPDITLLVDGARRNSNPSNTLSSPLYLDPYFLSRAEVVRGSSSSLYGSGGAGGAMAFTTLSAKDLLNAGRHVGFDVQAGYQSGDRSQHYNARVYGQSGKFDALVGLGYRDFNDIRQGGGTTLQLNDGHSESTLVKLGVQAVDKLRLEVSNQTFGQRSLEPNNPQLATTAQTQLAHVTSNETVVKAVTTNAAGETGLDARVYYSTLKLEHDQNGPNFPYLSNATNSLGASVQYTTRFSSESVGHHGLTYGLETFKDTLSSIRETAPNSFVPDGESRVSGAFVQDEIAFGSAWRLVPSARYDRFSATPTFVAAPSDTFNHVSPKISVAWLGVPGLNVYGNYGQAYRAPTVTEMYTNSLVNGVAPTSNFFNFAPNPNLKPATDTTLEIGGAFSRAQVFASADRLTVRATGFRSKASDLISSQTIGTYVRTGLGLIVLGPNGVISQSQNISEASRSGGELEASYDLDRWHIGANYSRLRVTDDATGNNLFAPPDKAVVQLRYAIPATDLSVMWKAAVVAAQDYDSTIARRRAGYNVHDLYTTWTPRAVKLKVDFSIGNLFDKQYLVYQSSNALTANAFEVGRNAKVTLSSSF